MTQDLWYKIPMPSSLKTVGNQFCFALVWGMWTPEQQERGSGWISSEASAAMWFWPQIALPKITGDRNFSQFKILMILWSGWTSWSEWPESGAREIYSLGQELLAGISEEISATWMHKHLSDEGGQRSLYINVGILEMFCLIPVRYGIIWSHRILPYFVTI